MSTVLGNSGFKFDKSTLKVSFKWQFNGHTFGEYLEFNKRCKNGLISTAEIVFQSGHLAFTNHHVQCYITPEDCSMYVKIHIGDTEIPPDFTHYELAQPRVSRKLETEEGEDENAIVLTEDLKTKLITQRYFTDEDFEAKKCTQYWLCWPLDIPKEVNCTYQQCGGKYRCRNCNVYLQSSPTGSISNICVRCHNYYQCTHCNRQYQATGTIATQMQQLQSYNGRTIILNFEFDSCFWNKGVHSMELSIPGDDEETLGDSTKEIDATLPIKSFLFSDRFCDFIIQCGQKTFNTHRLIIASKSLVFAAMLEQPIEVMKEGRLKIDGFQSETVEEFIRFMYTGKAKVNENATELFKMAHIYEVTDLKTVCENVLVSQVNADNLLDLNELGKQFKSQKLQDKCYSFFKLQRSTLLKDHSRADQFKDFMLRYTLE